MVGKGLTVQIPAAKPTYKELRLDKAKVAVKVNTTSGL